MTPELILTRIRDGLRLITMPTTSNKVFGPQVYVVPNVPAVQISQFITPQCWIVDNGDISHPEHPHLSWQAFDVLIFIENVHHAGGEGAILGSNVTTGYSTGIGAKKAEELVVNYLLGITTLLNASSVAERTTIKINRRMKKQIVSGNNPLVYCVVQCEAFCAITLN